MRVLAVSLATAAATLVSNAPASAQTVDEILLKLYAARGGLEKIKAIQSLKLTQTIGNPFSRTKVVILKKRPGLVRWEITPAGQTSPVLRAINAEGGWDSQQGKVAPRPDVMVKEERDLETDLEGPLVD